MILLICIGIFFSALVDLLTAVGHVFMGIVWVYDKTASFFKKWLKL